MSKPVTALKQTKPSEAPQGDGRRDWARALPERQLAVLGRLAEDGLEIAQAIKRQAVQADDPTPTAKVVRGDVTVAYARVARAVRLTLMLQAKVIEAIQRLDRNSRLTQPRPRPGLRSAGRA
jgi:hypothetical protein